MHCTFTGDRIFFRHYPFPCASVGANGGSVAAGDIAAFLPKRDPLELWLKTGEVLFVSREQIDDLTDFVDRHAVVIEDRMDVWGLLNEPCLDTSFTTEDEARTLEHLAECQITAHAVQQWRARTGRHLLLANSFWWEWMHLGHFDMLIAQRGLLHWPTTRRFHRLYSDSMEIAQKAIAISFDITQWRAELAVGGEAELHKLWQETMALLRPADGDEGKRTQVYKAILREYRHSRRAYHGLRHIAEVVAFVLRHRDRAENLPAVVLAGWLHDLFPPWRRRAEEKSAENARALLGDLGISAADAHQVSRLILSTKAHFTAPTPDEQLLADADIAVLGSNPAVYDRYARNIQSEFITTPKFLFRWGRRRFLEACMRQIAIRGRLGFQHGAAWEQQARENIRRELEQSEHWYA